MASSTVSLFKTFYATGFFHHISNNWGDAIHLLLRRSINRVAGISTHSGCSTSSDKTFKASDLQVTLAKPNQLQTKPDAKNLVFGKYFTDHMFTVKWNKSTSWDLPKIVPFEPLKIHPAAKVLHYAVELFEGMKAYRGVDGKIRLFRPDINMRRFLRGAKRAALPQFDPHEFLDCLMRLIKIEVDWIPNCENSSLYIRPTFIGTDQSIGISTPTDATLFVILCPVGPYFATGFKPVSLLADPQYVRAFPGGCGDTKLGSNYAPTIYVQQRAEDSGHQQVLWLFGEDHQLTEVGSMNIFFLTKNKRGDKELITPPLNGLILPGVTRQSILDVTREWQELKVTERVITMSELIELITSGNLLEVFGAGTACVVCPVDSISFEGRKYDVPTAKQQNPLYRKIFQNLSDIYYGKISHPWSVVVE